ncbi:MAG: ribokinase [Planctomycetota bacterium]
MTTLHNIGSINLDLVYHLPAIVRPGETLSASDCDRYPGGKGANQSIAAARAGQRVRHVGRVGEDGRWLADQLGAEGVEMEHVAIDPDLPTGHAIIQIDPAGENAIVLLAGANHGIDQAQLDRALADAHPDDWVLTQNETGNARQVIERAAHRGLPCALNPAPITDDLHGLSLESLALLVVNETESRFFAEDSTPMNRVRVLGKRVAGLAVLTLGAEGAVASDGERHWTVPGLTVPVVRDTTSAGDTFTGYLVAGLMAKRTVADALRFAAAAAALAVTKDGAIPSIPTAEATVRFLRDAGAND